MGLGSTAKKLQKLADIVEKTYKRLNELRDQLADLRSTVEDTGQRVEGLERAGAAQRALLDASAEDHALDPETVTADATASGSGDGSAASAAESTPTED